MQRLTQICLIKTLIIKQERKQKKHCQRHNGPRVLPLLLKLSLQLRISIGFNFDHQVAQFVLVAKLSTRWRRLH